jgi:hypothetical protein
MPSNQRPPLLPVHRVAIHDCLDCFCAVLLVHCAGKNADVLKMTTVEPMLSGGDLPVCHRTAQVTQATHAKHLHGPNVLPRLPLPPAPEPESSAPVSPPPGLGPEIPAFIGPTIRTRGERPCQQVSDSVCVPRVHISMS